MSDSFLSLAREAKCAERMAQSAGAERMAQSVMPCAMRYAIK